MTALHLNHWLGCDDFMNGPHFLDELLVLIEGQRLCAVRQSLLRLVVNFDDQSVGADGDTRASQRDNHVVLARAMRWIDDDRQVRDPANRGNRREVQRVARVLRERAHAALAKHDVIVAFRHDVFRRQQPFVQSCRQSAFEQHGQMRSPDAPQKGKVLHVARADLNHVSVTLNQIHAVFVERFRHDLQTVRFANLCQNLQSFFAQSLESVGRGPGFKSTAAKEARAAAPHGFGYRKSLSMTFDRAGSGDDRQLISANRSVADAHDTLLRTEIKRDQFVRLANAYSIGHARQVFETRRIDSSLVAGDADGGAGRARHRVRFESQFGNDFTDVRNLRVSGVGFHYDQHANY